MEEAEPKKKKLRSGNLTHIELEVIYTIFVPRYKDWVQPFVPGGSRKNIKNPRHLLVEHIVDELTRLDGSIERTFVQIHNRIRDDIAKVKNIISEKKKNYTGTGGGAGKPVAPTPNYLCTLEALLRKEESVTGVEGGLESSDIGPIAVVDPDPDNNLSNSMPASPVRSDQYDTSLLNIKREIRTPKESLEERQKKRSKLQRTRFEASDHFTIRKDILTEELRCWKAKAELAEMQLNAEKKQLEKEGYRKRQEDEERQIRLNMLKAQLEFYVSFRDRNNAGEPLVPTSYSFVPPTAYHPVKHNPLYDLTNLP